MRDDWFSERKSICNRRKHSCATHHVAKRINQQRLAQIERQLKPFEAEMRGIIDTREDLKRRLEILTSIPGVSNLTVRNLNNELSLLALNRAR